MGRRDSGGAHRLETGSRFAVRRRSSRDCVTQTDTGVVVEERWTQRRLHERWQRATCANGNDPSAGSPTETLLRLLLPLDHRVRSSLQRRTRARTHA